MIFFMISEDILIDFLGVGGLLILCILIVAIIGELSVDEPILLQCQRSLILDL